MGRAYVTVGDGAEESSLAVEATGGGASVIEQERNGGSVGSGSHQVGADRVKRIKTGSKERFQK